MASMLRCRGPYGSTGNSLLHKDPRNMHLAGSRPASLIPSRSWSGIQAVTVVCFGRIVGDQVLRDPLVMPTVGHLVDGWETPKATRHSGSTARKLSWAENRAEVESDSTLARMNGNCVSVTSSATVGEMDPHLEELDCRLGIKTRSRRPHRFLLTCQVHCRQARKRPCTLTIGRH